MVRGGRSFPKGQILKSRQRDNMIYGIRAVMEAIDSGKHFERVFVQKNLQGDLIKQFFTKISGSNIPLSTVPLEKLNQFTRQNHQGVVALVSPVQYHDLHNLVASLFEAGKEPFLVILDKITDVRNFGGIARSAECLGADGIVIPLRNGAQVTADAIKTSAGALNHLPVCRETSLKVAIQYLKDSGFRIISCTEKGDQQITEIDFRGPVAVIMGSEDEGITSSYLEMSDAQGRIPIFGNVNSLNVSAASAIVFYEISKRRT